MATYTQNWLMRHYCRIDTGTTTHEGVACRLMPGRTTAQIMRLDDQLEERPNVLGVVEVGRGQWLIDFADGTQWRIEELKQPCNCGGR